MLGLFTRIYPLTGSALSTLSPLSVRHCTPCCHYKHKRDKLPCYHLTISQVPISPLGGWVADIYTALSNRGLELTTLLMLYKHTNTRLWIMIIEQRCRVADLQVLQIIVALFLLFFVGFYIF